MDEGSSPYFTMIQACEAAIVRIRAAKRAGTQNSEAVGQDFMLIRQAVTPRLTRYAMSIRHLAPESAEEALEAMLDRLLDDVFSLTYVSLETQFGAYLNSMPKRVLYKIRRKYRRDDASFMMERLDADDTEDRPSLHETIADPMAERALANITEHEVLHTAINDLPDVERHVIVLRMQGHDNNAIAQFLGVSAATATRIYQRALAALQPRLGPIEE
jgi:RNA polymerase sigma factor (sigma-70 family)